jgi:hypothetical protein
LKLTTHGILIELSLSVKLPLIGNWHLACFSKILVCQKRVVHSSLIERREKKFFGKIRLKKIFPKFGASPQIVYDSSFAAEQGDRMSF